MKEAGHKNWVFYAEHIIETIPKIQRLEGRSNFHLDEDLYDSALRKLQTISEATQHLPTDLKNQHPDIDWKAITGFRNILVHGYLGDHIDTETVADVIKSYLPRLLMAVNSMLASR